MTVSTNHAIVPKDVGDTDTLCDLVSKFSQMQITTIADKYKYKTEFSSSDDESEDDKLNTGNERFIRYFTFHKDFPNILASLAKGNIIKILDNRIRNTEYVPGESLSPVPYKSNPLSALCDDNTIISYDSVNHIIKLWDLRRNCLTYNKEECPKNVFYLSSKGAHDLVDGKCHFESGLGDIKKDGFDFRDNSKNKYNLNYVLNWSGSGSEKYPSVVITYPDQKTPRRSSVVIEELPDDWVDTSKRSEILPIIYKHTRPKRKLCDLNEIVEVDVKKAISNCASCDKPITSIFFCDNCNVTLSKRKSIDEVCPENKRIRLLRCDEPCVLEKNKSNEDSIEVKGKRRSSEDLPPVTKRMLLDDGGKRTLQILQQNDNHKLKDGSPPVKPNSDSQTAGNVEEELDWKSKLRKENCEPRPAKIPKLLV